MHVTTYRSGVSKFGEMAHFTPQNFQEKFFLTKLNYFVLQYNLMDQPVKDALKFTYERVEFQNIFVGLYFGTPIV